MLNRIIRTRQELLAHLAVACELEQGLCLQYLFTGFSLKDSFSEGGIHTQEQLNFVREWKANLFHVGAQEMLHLTLAANLCSATGGTVQLRRPNFPQAPDYYPTRLPWRLDPFHPEVIQRYVCYERPVRWRDAPFDCQSTVPESLLYPKAGPSAFDHLEGTGLLATHNPRRVAHETIGQLYEAIRNAFISLPNVIIGDPEAQIEGGLVDFPQVFPVTNRDEAVRAVDLIVEQGEGTKSDRLDCHFGVFLNIYKEYQALKQKDPRFEPVRPVASNPLSNLHVDNTSRGWRLIDDEFTRTVNDLCSDVYVTMVLMLYRFFATTEESQDELRVLSRTFLRIMTGVIKPLGEAVTKLPMGPSTPGRNAGPSFEISRDIQLLPHKASAWTYLYERLLESSDRASELAGTPLAGDRKVEADLRNAALTLKQLAETFGARLPGVRR